MKTKMKQFSIALVVCAIAALIGALVPLPPVYAQSQLSRVAGRYVASNYQYRPVSVTTSNGATGAGTIGLSNCIATLNDGTPVSPFSVLAPIIVGVGTSAAETVTPTTVTSSGGSCSITATFTGIHYQNETVASATFGLNEAIVAAHATGGVVAVDPSFGGTDLTISASIALFHNVTIEDTRKGAPQYWSIVGGSTTLAAPATLTAATAVPSATPVGSYTTGTYHILIACVDVMGQEGPSSADFSEAGLATGSFVFTTPAAQTGCVGYTIYIGLTGGAAGTVYKVPLVTQPTTVGAYPASNGVCSALTTIETITPACSVLNATYGQAGATATVSALTVNTSPIAPQVTTVSTTSIYVPNAGGRTTYVWAPGQRTPSYGAPSSVLPFTISAADATTVPSVIGTINLAPGFMNYVGKTIEVCGYATTTASTGTIKNIQFQWDSMGQNTAGKGVPIGDLTVTQTSTTVTQLDFCQKFVTTVAAATATGGTIAPAGGYLTSTVATLVAAGAGGQTLVGGVGSLNLALDARINIIYVHTTNTDGTAVTLQNVSVRVI